MIEMRAMMGSVKKVGCDQPRKRASVASGPKRYSPSDLPIIQDTATGDTLADEKHPIVYPPFPDAPAAISFALQPKSKADDEKVMQGLHRLMEEDTALRVHRDEQTKEFVVSGSGQLHIEVAIERLKRKFGVEVELKAPKVPYKETIKGTAKAQGKHKRQTGVSPAR